MSKLFSLLAVLLLSLGVLFLSPKVWAAQNSYVTIVNPVRGPDFWSLQNQKPRDAVLGEEQILNKYNLDATWLIRYDALKNADVLSALENAPKGSEYGIFFEVTPTLTKDAGVAYHQSGSWHSAASVFLSGYSTNDRQKLIDTAFEQFKSDFGFYPKSVGAWWIDSYSLSYMQQKYGIVSSLEVADQYSTDNYQIWGQYFEAPYIPAKKDVLHPASESADKLPIVIMQWAARDPVNGYGNGVAESTYSVQANDYMDYHNLGINYFGSLIDLYTKQPFNQINQVTAGLENSYSWAKYGREYEKQIQLLSQKQKQGQFQVSTMSDFSQNYLRQFLDVSPTQTVVATDPLGTGKRSVWFMDPFYRLGWFYNNQGSVIRDIHQYIAGQEELCLKTVCDSVDFATSATRVLDDVSFGQNVILDPGGINNFSFAQNNGNYDLTYTNQAGTVRKLEFLKRDISLDGKVSTVDGFILNALSKPAANEKYKLADDPQKAAQFQEELPPLIFNIIKFMLILALGFLLPGYLILGKVLKEENLLTEVFLSVGLGMAVFTVLSYVFYFLNLFWPIILSLLILDILFFSKKLFRDFKFRVKFGRWEAFYLILILAGTIFQIIPAFRTGWVFDYGMGFWGANSHDGVWHIALVNQLLNGLPVTNPAFSGVILKDYHYLFDLLLAQTYKLTAIPVTDLLFRFYPMLFSLLLGAGSLALSLKLFKSKLAALISLYFIYFSGSFGWIVEYVKGRGFGGESDFWANQMVSFNFNMPFASSLVLFISFLILFSIYINKKSKALFWSLVLISGSLVGFKSYAGILCLGALFFTLVWQFSRARDLSLFKLTLISGLFSLLFILPNFTLGTQFFIISPFWLIYSMINDPGRLGWQRLALGLQAYSARGDIIKLMIVNILGLVFFLGGNLGMKILGGFNLFWVKLENKTVKTFLIIFSLFSVLIPLVFIQAGNSWNIIQFFYYFMYLAALFSGTALVTLIRKFPKALALPLATLILILVPVNALASVNMYMGKNPHTFISPNELEALNFLSQEPPGNVLTNPYSPKVKDSLEDPRPIFAYDSTAYVSAFSKKPTYLEDEIEQQILQTDYISRKVAEKDFFNSMNDTRPQTLEKEKNFLKSNKIKYIYLLKYFNISIDEQNLNLKKIFENPEVAVYGSNN